MTNVPDHLIDIGAEQAVLGAFLIDPDSLTDIMDDLAVIDFHDEGHQLIYRSLCDLRHEGTQADYLMLSRRIGQDNWPKLGTNGIRGNAYLTWLINQTPTAMNAHKYATIVSRLSTLRRLMSAAGDIAKLAYQANGDRLDDVFARARALVDRIMPARSDDAVLLWLDSLDVFFNIQIERNAEQLAIEAGEQPSRIDFPFHALKRFVNHIREGMLVGVASESGVGKTSFFETLAEYWASRLGLNVAFFHAELSHQVMLDRRMARQSGVPMADIENGMICNAMGLATERMRQWPGGIHYIHCPGWTVQRITNQARMLHDRGMCDVAIIDYLQKIRRVFQQGWNLAQVVGGQVEALKTCGEQLGIPVAVGSQFNRTTKGKAIKTSDDIRDTGELEEKTNIMITLDRPLDETTGQRTPIATVRVDKNTNGPTGTSVLAFNGPRYLFADLHQGAEQ